MTPADLDAYVLCGGLGTRLREEVSDRPKPLAEIAGRPFLDLLLATVARQGVRRFVLCAGHGASAIEAMRARLEVHGQIRVSVEDAPLGTGGALRLGLAPGGSSPILVLNGDSICTVDLAALLAHHRERMPVASVVISQVAAGGEFGSVELGPADRVRRFREKGGGVGPVWANAGVYLFEREPFVELAPAGSFSLEHDLLPPLAEEGGLLAYRHPGVFLDIGTPERFREAERTLRALGLLE